MHAGEKLLGRGFIYNDVSLEAVHFLIHTRREHNEFETQQMLILIIGM